MTEEQATTSQVEETGTGQEPTDKVEVQETKTEVKTGAKADAKAEPQSIEDLPEWVQKEIKALRKENASARTERKKLEDAEKSEVERLTQEASERQERIDRLTRRLNRASFIEQWQGPNARAAWALAQDEGLDIEYDEDERVKNLDAVRKELKKIDPQLFGDGTSDGGTRTQGNTGYDGPPGQGRLAHAYSNS